MRTLSYVFLISLMVSCSMNEPERYLTEMRSDQPVQVSFHAEIAGEEGLEVKSVLPDDIESRISDITLASYGADGILADVGYYDTPSDPMALLVDPYGGSTVYALVNMGDMSQAFPESEDYVSDIEYHVQSYSDVGRNGFPMSGKIELTSYEGGVVVIPVQRLFAKLRVRITHRSLAGYASSAHFAFNMCNRSLYIRQANSRLLPFSTMGSKAMNHTDILGSADYHPDLNDANAYQGSLSHSEIGPGPGYLQDTTLVLYVPENVQGNLLPYNKDPYGKVYEEIADIDGRSYSDLCTYLEFNARRENTQGYSGAVMYRYYLGADNTSDFSMVRNKRYDLTLDFTEDGFFAESWKVSRGDDWNDARILEFTDEPYLISPGGTARVLVHYHRFGSVDADSQLYPDDWGFLADESSMKNAGISYSFDPKSLVLDENGFERFCINVSAAPSAKVGASIPVKVISHDGSLSDESSITVIGRADFVPVWNNCPEYVSQEGIMSIAGVNKSDLPLSVTLSDPSRVSCVSVGEETFRLVACRTGKVDITVRNSSGTKTAGATLDIRAPRLVTDVSSVVLNPDGEQITFSYRYLDANGNALESVNSSAFDAYLHPVVDSEAYFRATVTSSSVKMCIASLYCSGKQVGLGNRYEAVISAVDCSDVVSRKIAVTVKDPFDGISVRDYGRIDDYTLFTLDGTASALRNLFAANLQANSSFEYQGFVPDSESGYVSVALEPMWTNGFSGANGVFIPVLDHRTSRIRVSGASISSSTNHSAGRHRMMIYVKNRHSGEKVGASCGELDLYVHTAVGARAVFGSQKCGWNPYGNETFASVYNYIAERTVYPSPSSDSQIYYMDVSMEWMTDISKVYVLDRMNKAVQSGTNWMDAQDIVRPSVTDGSLNTNTRMLYSVLSSPDSRISVCGETYGSRKGIGGVLYRALLQPTYTAALADVDIRRLFMGYESYTGTATMALAPCYTVHDMNKGPDMQRNKVLAKSPYYFSPSSCAAYRDSLGRGYHVIHFLEEMVPKTYGWINLL